MVIPLSIVDDVAIFDLGQQHQHHYMFPWYVVDQAVTFDSRTGNISHNHNIVPTRLGSNVTPPWSLIDEAVIFDSRTGNMPHNHNNVPPRLRSNVLSRNHNNVPPRLRSNVMSHNHNNVPPRLRSNVMSHNHNNVSVVDETVLYDSPMGNIPRRSRIHRTWSINHQTGHPHHHHHHHATRASPPVIGVQNTRPSPAVVMGVQDTSQPVTTSTTDAESVCCICLVDLSNGSSMPIRLRCSHLFHTDCIQKWINIRQTCPLCRANV